MGVLLFTLGFSGLCFAVVLAGGRLIGNWHIHKARCDGNHDYAERLLRERDEFWRFVRRFGRLDES